MARNVVHIHDGAIEEFMATLLLTTMPGVRLAAVVVVDGDCLGGVATQAAYQLDRYVSAVGEPTPIGLSAARGKNPFPWEYRGDCLIQSSVLTDLGAPRNPDWPFAGTFDTSWPPRYPAGAPATTHIGAPGWVQGFPSGETVLAATLETALANSETVTLAVTGPPTPIQLVLQDQPDLAAAIDEIVWYGPSLEGTPLHLWPVPAGVFSGYTDWNAFWDPDATAFLFGLPLVAPTVTLTMIAGTLAGGIVIEGVFLDRLAAQAPTSRLSQLAYASYSPVAASKETTMWDTLTVSYLDRPDLFAGEHTQTLSCYPAGALQGVVVPDENGARTKLFTGVDKAAFYDYVLTQLR